MEKQLIMGLMLLMAFSVGTMAQNKKNKKSAAQLSKQYVQYAKDKAKGKEKLAEKKASDPATVTREKGDTTVKEKPKTFEDAYNEFKQQAKSNYENFRDRANRDYAEFVKEAWRQHKVLPAIPKPKDENIPPVEMDEKEKNKPKKDNPLPIEEVVTPTVPEPQPVPIAPIREQPQPQEKWKSFMVYGTEMKVRFNDDEWFDMKNCSEETVSEIWKRLSSVAYNNTIRDCLELRITKKLSDWAYLNMLNKMAEACLGKGNAATMLMAYVYCQSGYKMRLARAENRLFILYGTKHCIYGKGYFTIDGEDYYSFNGEVKNVEICKVAFPNEKPLSLLIPQQQGFAVEKTAERILTSKRYGGMQVKVCGNKNLMAFYNDYPSSMLDFNFMTRWAMYANTPLEKTAREALYPVLREKLKGKNELEAVERLLNWVQTAFVYEYDDKVWGCDRAFFAEESLYYPYCDCEDRSILFSRLVRDLLGLKVVLVFYPGHLATAVHFSNDVKGDYIMLDGARYTVCDPTYINAPVGNTMPRMDNSTAKVILLASE